MNTWAWLGGGAALGAVAAGWEKTKGVLMRIVNLVVMTVKVDGEASSALRLYCWSNFRRSNWGERFYDGQRIFVRPMRRVQAIAYEDVGYTSILFWDGWKPILVGVHDAASDRQHAYSGRTITLTFMRGLFSVDGLIQAAVDAYNSSHDRGLRSTRFRIERRLGSGSVHSRPTGGNSQPDAPAWAEGDVCLGDRRILRWNPDDLGADSGVVGKLLDGLAFPEPVLAAVTEARRWLGGEDWFRDRQIPWRWGWLLYGKPGTGKSALVRAIAQELDLPIFSFDLASMSNQELVSDWQSMLSSSPCVALFEDIDAVFDGRDNTLGEMGGGLTFDCLLNCLSGVEGCDGVFSIVTTNRIERLDVALGTPDASRGAISTRPGRIDRVLHLGEIDEPCRRRLANRVFRDNKEDANTLVAQGDGDTPAQFMNRCVQKSMLAFKAKEA